MDPFSQSVAITETIRVGGHNPRMTLFSGPCVAESYDLCMEVGTQVKAICQQLNINYVFKASFDKANRTSVLSYRGPLIDKGLEVLSMIQSQLNVPVITDIHEIHQCQEAASVVDVLQIPAFLCRQTDLLVSAAHTGKPILIKKGQFMAPEDMKHAVEKVRSVKKSQVFLAERGSTFGYHNLVVDMRSLPIMRQYAPVIFDVTHSVQNPGGMGKSSGGDRRFAPYLAKAAAACGVDGFFIETHPNPQKAPSDGANMIPLHELKSVLMDILKVWRVTSTRYTE